MRGGEQAMAVVAMAMAREEVATAVAAMARAVEAMARVAVAMARVAVAKVGEARVADLEVAATVAGRAVEKAVVTVREERVAVRVGE